MRWQARRKTEGFNLAFLDIMSCGLGAAILIFMLVKHQPESGEVESSAALQAELDGVRNAAAAIAANNAQRSVQLEQLKQTLRRRINSLAQSSKDADSMQKELERLQQVIAELQQKKAEQKRQAAVEQAEPAAPKPQQDHLIGLRMEGERIIILLDNSASMAAERLLDIVKIKVSDATAKKAAPKWRRTMAIVEWMIERVPENSRYMVINYNATAGFLPANRWLKGGDAGARSTLTQSLAQLYPQAATDLYSALELITSSAIDPTDIYVVTDSLPTEGLQHLSTLQRVKGCGKLTKRASTVSGKCRLALFYATIKAFSNRLSAASINVVLLPIEGDPDAAAAYWNWAAGSNGVMVSPAGSWP